MSKLEAVDPHDNRLNRMQNEFMEQHKDADIIECSQKTGNCLRAIYLSPVEKFIEKPLREFCEAVGSLESET